jgi:hypothetical protein
VTRARRRGAGDGAEADEPEHLARCLAPDEARPRPGARENLGARLVGAAQQHQGAGHDVLGDRVDVGAGRGVDRDPPRIARGHVDVVESHAEPANGLESRCSCEQRRVDPGLVAHHQGAALAEQGDDGLGPGVKIGVVVHLVRCGEGVARGVIDELGDDDGRHSGSVS